MKKLIFSLISKHLLIAIAFMLCALNGYSQTGQCGFYIKPTTPLEPKYADRFGNLYSQEELQVQARGLPNDPKVCTDLKNFDLVFDTQKTPTSVTISDDEKETICQVFRYLEDVVFADVPKNKIKIEINKDDNVTQQVPKGVLAFATPYFEKEVCGISQSTFFQAMKGRDYPNNQILGSVMISADYTLHLLKDDPSSPPQNPFNIEDGTYDKYDLFTILLHEVLHIVSFHSYLDPVTGKPAVANYSYTPWDKLLYSDIVQKRLLEKATTDDCCDFRKFDDISFPNPNFTKKCDSKIWTVDNGNNKLAQLPCHDNNINGLSHLANDCPSVGSSTYVMNPEIDKNYKLREIPATEKKIICAYGYKLKQNAQIPVPDNCTSGCYVYANADSYNEFLKINDIISINVKSNDTYTPNSVFNLLPTGSGIKVTPDWNKGTLTIEALERGDWDICYEIKDCDGNCSKSCFNVVIIDPNLGNCCDKTKNCNISCLGSFEDFTSDFELRHFLSNQQTVNGNDVFFMAPQTDVNTIDIRYIGRDDFDYCDGTQTHTVKNGATDGANGTKKYVGFWAGKNGKGDNVTEGFVLPLCKQVLSKTKAKIKFWAKVSQKCIDADSRPYVDMSFISNMPTPGLKYQKQTKALTVEIKNAKWTQYTIDFNPNEGENGCFLLISGRTGDKTAPSAVYIHIDEIEVLYNAYEVQTSITPSSCSSAKVEYKICNNNQNCNGVGTADDSPLDATVEIPNNLNFTYNGVQQVSPFTINIKAGEIPYKSATDHCKNYVFEVTEKNNATSNNELNIKLKSANTKCEFETNKKDNLTFIKQSDFKFTKKYTYDKTTGIYTFDLQILNLSNVQVNANLLDFLPTLLVPTKSMQTAGWSLNTKKNAYERNSTIKAGPGILTTIPFEATEKDCICKDVINTAELAFSDVCKISASVNVQPQNPITLDANFTAVSKGYTVGDCKTFTFNSIPNLPNCVKHSWDFGDGQIFGTANPTHIYKTVGSFTVIHTVSTECGTVTSSQVVTTACLECGCDAANTLTIKTASTGTLFSTLNLPLIINKSVHNGCIAIEGKLIIDQNVTIQDCADIRMQPCSEIVVRRSKNFAVNNNIIYGCKKMWKGITVEAGGRLNFSNNNIKDAEFSIDANASKIFPPPYTTILVRGNTFQKNHVGVRINGSSSSSSTSIVRQAAPFINNTFIGNGATDLLPPCTDKLANYSAKFGYTGLIVAGVNFVVGTSKDTKITNTFSSLRNGILSSDNYLQVFNASFNNLDVIGPWADEKIDPVSSKSFGIGILSNRTKAVVTGCTFKKCGHAVFAKNSILSVTKCDMPEVYRGVEFVNGLQIDVNDNQTIHYKNRAIIGRELSYAKTGKFNINRNKIHNIIDGNTTELNNNIAVEMVNKTADTLTEARMFKNVIILDNKDHGIYVKQSGKWTIDGNYVQYENVVKDYQSGLGNAFRFDNSRRNYLYDNLTEDVAGKGRSVAYALSISKSNNLCCNVADGNQTGLVINGGCDNTNIKTTAFSNHNFCLNYTAQGVTGAQTNNGNTYSISSGTANHNGDDFTIGKSLYFTKDKTSIEFPQKITLPLGAKVDWFAPNLQNSLTCSTCTVPPIAPFTPEISELDLFIINEGFGNKTAGNRTSQWESERDLFRRIGEKPNLLNSNDKVNNFYLKNKKGKLGAHFEVDRSIRGISENTEEVDAKIEELLFRIDDINKTAEKEYANLTKAVTFEDSLMIYGAAEEIRITATPHTLLLNALLEDAEKLQAEKAASILPMIAALEANDLATKNRKSILAIYANNLAKGGGILSANDLENVRALAYQCVEEGGTGVIMARAIYRSYANTFIDDNLLCSPSSNTIISKVAKDQQQSDAIDLDVFPNPAQDNVNLMVTSNGKVPFEIVVTNYTGTIIKKINNNGLESPIYTLNTQGLPSGIYFCRIKSDNGLIITKKLIIQK